MKFIVKIFLPFTYNHGHMSTLAPEVGIYGMDK